MNLNITKYLRLMVFSSLFAALITLGAYVFIPMVPVPIVLANFFVFLGALLLGPVWGTVSVVIYLLLGLLNVPVFSLGRAGFVHFFGPLGGYLIGYIPAAILAGLISGSGRPSLVKNSAALILAAMAIYAIGVPWLKLRAGMTWDKALVSGMALFLAGDAIKIAAAVILAQFLKPLVNEFIRPVRVDAHDQESHA
jgi:biotin transport system substrate-specific component